MGHPRDGPPRARRRAGRGARPGVDGRTAPRREHRVRPDHQPLVRPDPGGPSGHRARAGRLGGRRSRGGAGARDRDGTRDRARGGARRPPGRPRVRNRQPVRSWRNRVGAAGAAGADPAVARRARPHRPGGHPRGGRVPRPARPARHRCPAGRSGVRQHGLDPRPHRRSDPSRFFGPLPGGRMDRTSPPVPGAALDHGRTRLVRGGRPSRLPGGGDPQPGVRHGAGHRGPPRSDNRRPAGGRA